MNVHGWDLAVGCLRCDLLAHLGAEKPPTRADECCLLCDPSLNAPWVDEPSWLDYTDPGRYHDPRFAVLKAIAWNGTLETKQGRAPYGARTLTYIVLGNDYMATRYIEDPERKKNRRRSILASEHFGVLQGLSNGTTVVEGIIEDLKNQGYTIDVERGWNGNTYSYPSPTEKGWDRLAEADSSYDLQF